MVMMKGERKRVGERVMMMMMMMKGERKRVGERVMMMMMKGERKRVGIEWLGLGRLGLPVWIWAVSLRPLVRNVLN